MPLKAKIILCGARARQNNHLPCRQPAMKNGRCRLHGGKCTGAKTPEGKEKAAKANFKHGMYTKQAMMERRQTRMMMKWRHDLDNF